MPHDERPQTQSFMDRLQPKKLLKGLKDAVQGKCSTAPAGTAGGNGFGCLIPDLEGEYYITGIALPGDGGLVPV